MNDFADFKKLVQAEKRFIIYGAQHHAHCMHIALKRLLPDVVNLFFMVSDKKDNPESLEGLDVRVIADCGREYRQVPVLVAVSERYCDEIFGGLEAQKFSNIVNGAFGGRFDNDVRELYFQNCFLSGTAQFQILAHMDGAKGHPGLDIGIYVAKSAADRKLQMELPMPEYAHTVLAGAALTKGKTADCRDDTGVNISHKNRNYCECTVAYHIWKNAKEAFVGLWHYRRRFLWDAKDMEILKGGGADVVLPYPVITVKGEYAVHYRPYVDEYAYQVMLSVLRESWPEYYATALEVMRGDLFYPCNILAAKREIFAEYARWLFEVLEKVEDICGDENVREDRYLGYLAEHLTTFYFVRNLKNMNVAHSRMEILT